MSEELGLELEATRADEHLFYVIHQVTGRRYLCSYEEWEAQVRAGFARIREAWEARDRAFEEQR